jgi:transposase
VPVPVTAPAGGGFVPRVSQRGGRVIARRADGQSHRLCDARSPRQKAALAHGCHDLRHQPDRAAQEITMDLASTGITTGDVARLAGCYEKPA